MEILQVFWDIKIRDKLLGGFVLAMVGAAIAATGTFITFNKIEHQTELMLEAAHTNFDVAESLQVPMLEIQQLLTDAALTNSAEAVEAASGLAGLFRKSMKKVSVQCNDCHLSLSKKLGRELPDGLEYSRQITKEFDEYFETGSKMVEAYRFEGPAAGNVHMEKFDELASSINSQLSELVQMGMNHISTNQASMEKFAMFAKNLTMYSTGIALFLGIFIAIFQAIDMSMTIKLAASC